MEWEIEKLRRALELKEETIQKLKNRIEDLEKEIENY